MFNIEMRKIFCWVNDFYTTEAPLWDHLQQTAIIQYFNKYFMSVSALHPSSHPSPLLSPRPHLLPPPSFSPSLLFPSHSPLPSPINTSNNSLSATPFSRLQMFWQIRFDMFFCWQCRHEFKSYSADWGPTQRWQRNLGNFFIVVT